MAKHTVTFIVAPSIPESERKHLEKTWKKHSRIFANYDIAVFQVAVRKRSKYVITAPGVPREEVRKLNKKFKKNPNFIVVNYEVVVQEVGA